MACQPPNGLPFSCRERAAQQGIKKATISRAKRSAGTAGWAAYPGQEQLVRMLTMFHSFDYLQDILPGCWWSVTCLFEGAFHPCGPILLFSQ
jgi:hypothetical protein